MEVIAQVKNKLLKLEIPEGTRKRTGAEKGRRKEA